MLNYIFHKQNKNCLSQNVCVQRGEAFFKISELFLNQTISLNQLNTEYLFSYSFEAILLKREHCQACEVVTFAVPDLGRA